MRYFIAFLLVTSLFVSCKKDDDQAIIDEEIILAYLHDNNLEDQATKDASGMYYIIYNEGSGGYPTIKDSVMVEYKGYLTNGDVFDKTSNNKPVTFLLKDLIKGWQVGIPMLQKGGNGLFLIPSGLGYGDINLSGIPANSVLIFEIKLVDFIDEQQIIDELIILKYLEDHSLQNEATKDSSGLYYIIYVDGNGGYPNINSTVEVKYKGFLSDGYVFDQTTGSSTASFPLNYLIEGWKIGIPMLQKGGNGLFLMPSALGYGSANQSGIPANSVLIFEITLVDF
jgi:FKBP-type peptidyl-prolyl cis-trans isomerase FkpA